MAVLEHEVRSIDNSILMSTHRHLFTREEYYSLGSVGILGDAQIELIGGELIKMPSISPQHATISDPLTAILKEAFGSGHTVRNQAPISIVTDAAASEPQPDIVVASDSWRDYLSQHPSPADVQLIVEISDSTLVYDRTVKTALYATAGIPEYWILNLVDAQLEVYRNPAGSVYTERAIYRAGESIEPLLAVGKSIFVADFMP